MGVGDAIVALFCTSGFDDKSDRIRSVRAECRYQPPFVPPNPPFGADLLHSHAPSASLWSANHP